jgi:hypothetical protein
MIAFFTLKLRTETKALINRPFLSHAPRPRLQNGRINARRTL